MSTFCCPNCRALALLELEAEGCYWCTACHNGWEIAYHGEFYCGRLAEDSPIFAEPNQQPPMKIKEFHDGSIREVQP